MLFRLADKRYRFGYATLTIHSQPYDTTKSIPSTITLKDKTLTHSLPEKSKKNWQTTFSRLPGKPWRQLTTDNSLQETDTYRQITGRVILQPDITQGHNYQDSHATSAANMQQTAYPTKTSTLTVFFQRTTITKTSSDETLTDLLLLPKLTTTQPLRL